MTSENEDDGDSEIFDRYTLDSLSPYIACALLSDSNNIQNMVRIALFPSDCNTCFETLSLIDMSIIKRAHNEKQ